jgi:ABC-type dipeptide/oligopeptide/nickel transport system ATPase component
MPENILEIKSLRIYFYPLSQNTTRSGINKAVDGVDIEIRKNEVYGICGESGSGKTLTALSILKILPPQAAIVGGSVFFEDNDLLRMPDEDIRTIRGSRISFVFQEPASAFNPVFTVGYQITEAAVTHQKLTARRAKELTLEYLKTVHVSDPLKVYGDYPHQLSGGTKQRAMIAMALINSPELIILDEPTTALDVTIQAQILDLLEEIRDKEKASMLLISHDFGIISRMCGWVSVMRRGKVVEAGETAEVIGNPKNEYTRSLLESVKTLGN